MPLSAILKPALDPTPIFEHFRGHYATELLTAAVSGFDLFGKLATGPKPSESFRNELGLAKRSFVVLTTALRAMNLLEINRAGQFDLTPLGREHLIPGGPFYVGDYVALLEDSPGVKEMIERLKTNRPAGAKDEKGAAFIFREGLESAMEKEASARHLTLGLAGRAKNVSPYVAERVPLGDAKVLLDVGGGTGIYSIALVQKNPRLRSIIWDRPEVLKVAREFAEMYGVSDRLEFRAGNMFADAVPSGADVVLLSNVLHDWDVPECQTLLKRCADVLPSGGHLLIHDVFLSDALDGPLPVSLYSAALFAMTEGRAYSAAEYQSWLVELGLQPREIVPTLIHCGVMGAIKP
jgi:ubiquinone/menaquinone biosynthesis C-methylase UbiE